MNVISMSIKDLHFDPANARKHGEKNLEALRASMAKFGQQKVIVVDEKNIVLAGNATLQVARELGWEKIYVQRSALKGTDATAFAIADNRIAELGEWDKEVLGAQLEALNAEGFDWEAVGFGMDDFVKFTGFEVMPEPEEPAESPQEKCPECGQKLKAK